MKTIDAVSDPAASPSGQVNPGDTVEALLTDGQRVRFVVHRPDRDALVSVEGIRSPRAGIEQLQRQSLDPGKSTGLFFVLLGVIGNLLL
jgi:hypothetical protein